MQLPAAGLRADHQLARRILGQDAKAVLLQGGQVKRHSPTLTQCTYAYGIQLQLKRIPPDVRIQWGQSGVRDHSSRASTIR
jgi:hypothetical protein